MSRLQSPVWISLLILLSIFTVSCSSVSRVIIYDESRILPPKPYDYSLKIYKSKAVIKSFRVIGEIIVAPNEFDEVGIIEYFTQQVRNYGADGIMDLEKHFFDGRVEEPEMHAGSYILESTNMMRSANISSKSARYRYHAKLIVFKENDTIAIRKTFSGIIDYRAEIRCGSRINIIPKGDRGKFYMYIKNDQDEALNINRVKLVPLDNAPIKISKNNIIARNINLEPGEDYQSEFPIAVPSDFETTTIQFRFELVGKNDKNIVDPIFIHLDIVEE